MPCMSHFVFKVIILSVALHCHPDCAYNLAAFSLWPELAKEVNHHFLLNEYSDQSLFSLVLN